MLRIAPLSLLLALASPAQPPLPSPAPPATPDERDVAFLTDLARHAAGAWAGREPSR